jgi:hypothetical protein
VFNRSGSAPASAGPFSADVPSILPAAFYARHTLDVARDLIGMVLLPPTTRPHPIPRPMLQASSTLIVTERAHGDAVRTFVASARVQLDSGVFCQTR